MRDRWSFWLLEHCNDYGGLSTNAPEFYSQHFLKLLSQRSLELALHAALPVTWFPIFLQFCDCIGKFLSANLPPLFFFALVIQSQLLLYVIERTCINTLRIGCAFWSAKKHSVYALQENKCFSSWDVPVEIFS